jgi:cell division protein FtsN
MPQFERRLYEPSDDMRAFNAGDDDFEEEGSRLPLLIVIALVVLASFAGVVWLAYTQGVQRGREIAPRMIAAQPAQKAASSEKNPYAGLNIYKPAKPDDEGINQDSAPSPRRAVVPPKTIVSAPAVPPATKSTITAAKPLIARTIGRAAPTKPAVLAQKTARPLPKPSAKTTRPAPPRVATAAPRTTAPPSSLALTPKPAAPAVKPAPIAPEPTPIVPKTAPQTPKSTAVITPARRTVTFNPPATKTVAAAEPEAHAGGFVLQIGSYKSEAEANTSWQAYKVAHPAVAGYAPDVRRAELGAKGTWYRLRVGPFASLSEANAACAKLKASGGNCFPAKH